MNKAEKQRIINLPTTATCWEDYPGGVEIKEIEYGIEDYCLCVTQTMTDSPRAHRVKIKYTDSNDDCRPYISIDGFRIYMEDCLRITA